MGGGTSQFQGGGGTFRPYEKDRRASEDIAPEDDIWMRFFQRVINDTLKGQIDPEALRRLPQFQDSGVPIIYSDPRA